MPASTPCFRALLKYTNPIGNYGIRGSAVFRHFQPHLLVHECFLIHDLKHQRACTFATVNVIFDRPYFDFHEMQLREVIEGLPKSYHFLSIGAMFWRPLHSIFPVHDLAEFASPSWPERCQLWNGSDSAWCFHITLADQKTAAHKLAVFEQICALLLP